MLGSWCAAAFLGENMRARFEQKAKAAKAKVRRSSKSQAKEDAKAIVNEFERFKDQDTEVDEIGVGE